MLRHLATGCLVALGLTAPPAGAQTADAGAIAGIVTVRERAPSRLASRYAGAGGAAVHEAAPVPMMVYVVGKLEGTPPPDAPRPARMAQRDTTFTPGVLVVAPGTTVEFPNQDPFYHNVFSFSKPKRFDLGRYPAGETKTVSFDRPGVVKVYCEVHKWMRAAVLVLENPYYAQVGADGRFRIDGLPPGRYRVAVWNVDRGEKVVEVTVRPGATAPLELVL